MKLVVVDSNGLRGPDLRAYLAASRSNGVVVPRLVELEAFKHEPLLTARNSYRQLRSYPERVFFLRDASDFADRSIEGRHGARKLISRTETAGFAPFCQDLYQPSPTAAFQAEVTAYHRDALLFMRQLETESAHIEGLYRSIASSRFSREQVRLIRKGERYTPEIMKELIDLMREASGNLFTQLRTPKRRWPADLPGARNTFLFRYAMCMVLLYTRFVRVGNLSRVLNDVVDMQIVAQATFFSGFISADQRAQSVHREARFLLRSIGGYVG